METKRLADNYVVSAQITVDDVDAIAEQGFQLLICNRPDGEAEGQTPYAEIEKRAKELGLEVANIPFVGGQLQENQVAEFAELMARDLNTFAYCRTGNRCSVIWEESKKL
jgi:sulfide:quinone oxidoreductase